jgi:hypothetical protein
MQEIAELERRITAALERIGRGVEGLTAAAATPSAMLPESEFARLNDALDEERMANAQLNERLRIHRDREATLAAEVADLTEQLAGREAELDELRAARGAEAAELADIVSALTPLIEEAAQNA